MPCEFWIIATAALVAFIIGYFLGAKDSEKSNKYVTQLYISGELDKLYASNRRRLKTLQDASYEFKSR